MSYINPAKGGPTDIEIPRMNTSSPYALATFSFPRIFSRITGGRLKNAENETPNQTATMMASSRLQVMGKINILIPAESMERKVTTNGFSFGP